MKQLFSHVLNKITIYIVMWKLNIIVSNDIHYLDLVLELDTIHCVIAATVCVWGGWTGSKKL